MDKRFQCMHIMYAWCFMVLYTWYICVLSVRWLWYNILPVLARAETGGSRTLRGNGREKSLTKHKHKTQTPLQRNTALLLSRASFLAFIASIPIYSPPSPSTAILIRAHHPSVAPERTDNAALVHHDNKVCVGDGGEAVRHQHDGAVAVANEEVQRFLNLRLVFCVCMGHRC